MNKNYLIFLHYALFFCTKLNKTVTALYVQVLIGSEKNGNDNHSLTLETIIEMSKIIGVVVPSKTRLLHDKRKNQITFQGSLREYYLHV
ncbi:hypothetical protein BpHYR1_010752 [Brachionus plicatilis]|uniref:Uncharacterized protein n=1 Tax=Brachionus plicatilis TaxID=10195 RepID=A0A3M7QTK9_BRAPC|nr:hypothetical protein BpHYR1_010752 [Brachionus plicatilis]